MPSRIWIKLAAILVGALLVVALFEAWRADRRDRDRLEAELAATKQVLAAADSRQRDRDGQLVQTLASLAAEKRTATTPTQIIHELPGVIPLPTPLTLQPNSGVSSQTDPTASSTGKPGSSQPVRSPQPKVLIPSEDLKPLYDFALDCKACQAKLTTSQADLSDEKTKTVALTKERDDALKIAKGGSALRRIARAAKWFALGAAAGAIAAKAAH
jgi:type II secretory pathway pseudopilin PulG